MPSVVHDARAMVAGMTPILRPGQYIFCSTRDQGLIDQLRDAAVCIFKEDEGVSMIVGLEAGTRANGDGNIDTSNPMRRIVLEVYSSLEGSGLTAAVSTALSEAHISCNMVAAFHHDHVFVPAGDADCAMETLLRLQREAAESSS